MELTKDSIQALLMSNDKAVGRALAVLLRNQTSDEVAGQSTYRANGCGFKPCHARMGTSLAQFFNRNGYLSPKQLSYARGKMNISQYHRQLIEAAKIKQAAQTEIHQ